MSEKDINRWQETITPRDTSKPWVMGPGGSFDMQDVQPIPDSMLAELAKLYNSHGCPWNCRSLPLSPSDREYMYLLYFSMQGLVARMRLGERRVADLEDVLRAAREHINALRESLIQAHTDPKTGQLDADGEAAAAEDGALLQWIDTVLAGNAGVQGTSGGER